MTSKNSFFDLHLYTGRLRRGSWLTGLIAGVLFFALPVTAALTTGDAQYLLTELNVPPERIQNRISSLVQSSSIFVMVLAVSFAILAALITWSWLNSRQQVDFYHSLPVSRQSLFTTSYAYGLTAFLAPLLLMQGLSLMVIAFNGFGSYIPWAMFGEYLLRIVVLYLSVFSICTMACMLCGSTLVSFFGSGVFLVGPPALVGLIIATYSKYYETFFFNDDFWLPLFRRISPIADQFGTFGEDYYLLWWLLLSAALAGLSLLACVKRPSEGAGRAIVFNIAKPIIRLSLVGLATLGMGYFFRELGNSDGWMLFGFVAGAVFMSMLVQGIFAFDIRAVFQGMKSLAVFGVCFAACFSVFYFDLTGFDSRLPERSRVEQAGISLGGTSHLLNQSGGISGTQWYDDAEVLKYMTFSDPEIIDIAVELAEAGVDYLGNSRYEDYSGGWSYLSLSFKQGGTRFFRSYRVPQQAVDEALERLYNNQTYKSRLYFVYTAVAGEYKSMVLIDPFRDSGDYGGTNYADPQLVEELLEALRQDIADTTADDMRQARGLATITFSTSEVPGARNRYPMVDRTIAVFDKYERSIAVLQKHNIALPQRPTSGEVESIRIHYYLDRLSADYERIAALFRSGLIPRDTSELGTPAYYEEYGEYIYGEYYAEAEKYGYATSQRNPLAWHEITVTDPATIDALIRELEPSDPLDYNLFVSTQNGLNLELYTDDSLNYGVNALYAPSGQASDLLIGLIVEDASQLLSSSMDSGQAADVDPDPQPPVSMEEDPEATEPLSPAA